MTKEEIPVSRVEWKGAVRIIRSAFPPIDLFEDIADPADWPLLISAEQKTNPRIMATIGNLDLVPVDRRVGGDLDPLDPGDPAEAMILVLQTCASVEDRVAGVADDVCIYQPGPIDVTASAPCGFESSCTCIGGGADLNESNEKEEQPARLSPAAAITMIRRMIHTLLRQSATIPGPTIGASEQRRNRARPVR